MITTILRQYRFNLQYAYELVADCTEAEMTLQPATGFENHPAFALGHLVTGSAMLAEELGGTYSIPDGWHELFQRTGPTDDRMPDVLAIYPTKTQLLTELGRQHHAVEALLENIDPARLQQHVPWRFAARMPSLLDLVTFMCITHEAMHLGQLSAWRRAMHKAPVLRNL
jgi:hypothetical protein